MKRYVWSKRGHVYHDRYDGAVERCNLDDLRGREEGDLPPLGRRLCEHCAAMRDLRRSIPTG